MSTKLALRPEQRALTQPDASLPSESQWGHMMTMALAIHKSGVFATLKNPESIALAMLKGRELGVPATHAMQSIYVVNGKATCSAELMLALVQRDHGRDALWVDPGEGDDTQATVHYRLPDGTYGAYTFTMEMAKKAGLLTNATWTKYPGNMLRWRAVSNAAKAVFPGSIAGLYTPEEMGADIAFDHDGNMSVIDAPSRPAPASKPRDADRIHYYPQGREARRIVDEIEGAHEDREAEAEERAVIAEFRDVTQDTTTIADSDGVLLDASGPSSDAQRHALNEARETQGWTIEEVQQEMLARFNKKASRDLTAAEADELLGRIRNPGAPDTF